MQDRDFGQAEKGKIVFSFAQEADKMPDHE